MQQTTPFVPGNAAERWLLSASSAAPWRLFRPQRFRRAVWGCQPVGLRVPEAYARTAHTVASPARLWWTWEPGPPGYTVCKTACISASLQGQNIGTDPAELLCNLEWVTPKMTQPAAEKPLTNAIPYLEFIYTRRRGGHSVGHFRPKLIQHHHAKL